MCLKRALTDQVASEVLKETCVAMRRWQSLMMRDSHVMHMSKGDNLPVYTYMNFKVTVKFALLIST